MQECSDIGVLGGVSLLTSLWPRGGKRPPALPDIPLCNEASERDSDASDPDDAVRCVPAELPAVVEPPPLPLEEADAR